MKEDRKDYITLKLPQLAIDILCNVKIFAIESFEKESEPIEGNISLS